MGDCLIGVDVGSSSCKVAIIDGEGQIIASSSQPYPTQYPQIGWAEQDPEDWYQAACSAIRSSLNAANLDPRRVLGMAVDGPAHNVALMDAQGDVLRSTLHWSDLRSAPQSERLERELGERIFEISNCPVHPSWTLAQLLWLKENDAEVWQQLRRVLVTKDYVRFRFTGCYETDPYDAIGTQLYDAARDQWSAELCALLDFDPDWLPQVRPATECSGQLQESAAQDTGLIAGIPVAVGSGDSVVEAMGVGAICPGQGIVKLGTAANVNLVTAQAQPSRLSLTYRHVVEPHWFTITATNSGTATLRWFRDTFCRLESQQARDGKMDVYTMISQMAEDVPAGSEGLLFHPYLMGERTPYWDPKLRGNFFGIRAGHELRHFARAILEGVAYSIRDCLNAVMALGVPAKQFALVGGGAKSKLWQQIMCDVLGTSLTRPRIEDAAFGSALLAGVAVGVFESWEAAVESCVHGALRLEPDPARQERYEQGFDLYRAIAADLQRHSAALAQFQTEGGSESA